MLYVITKSDFRRGYLIYGIRVCQCYRLNRSQFRNNVSISNYRSYCGRHSTIYHVFPCWHRGCTHVPKIIYVIFKMGYKKIVMVLFWRCKWTMVKHSLKRFSVLFLRNTIITKSLEHTWRNCIFLLADLLLPDKRSQFSLIAQTVWQLKRLQQKSEDHMGG